MITHYDLFAGIGGFSLALDTVFYDHKIKHIFSEWEHFPTEVLKKHWPEGVFYGDIADLVADTAEQGWTWSSKQDAGRRGQPSREVSYEEQEMVILTGGFPCQPFSHAGRRRGTSDDRYKWPEMLEVIRNVKPDWIIAENVRGLVTWSEGMVLEQVCADLESEGYEVQPLIIPAVAVNAPHRRDRIWIIANAIDNRPRRAQPKEFGLSDRLSQEHRAQHSATRKSERTDNNGQTSRSAPNTRGKKSGGVSDSARQEISETWQSNWSRDWREVAFATCNDSVDARFPAWLAGLKNDVYDTMMGYGTPSYTRTTKNLSYLQKTIQSKEVQRQIGGLYQVGETPVLLEILRQYLFRVEQCQKLPSQMAQDEHREESMQSVWLEEIRRSANLYPSYRWEHHEQRSKELSDIMPVLSYEVARRITQEGHCLWLLFKNLHPQAFPEREVGGVSYSAAKYRKEALKAYGNAIVPQVAMQIFEAIKSSSNC